MKFTVKEKWLKRNIAPADESNAAAGGTSMEHLSGDVQRRRVTPQSLAPVPTEIGKAVRYIREQRGWSASDLSRIADVELDEILRLEREEHFSLSPRAV